MNGETFSDTGEYQIKIRFRGQGVDFQFVSRASSWKCLSDIRAGISGRRLNKQVWSSEEMSGLEEQILECLAHR